MLLSDHTSPVAVHWRILLVSWLGWLSVFATLMLFIFLGGRYGPDLSFSPTDAGNLKSWALAMTGLGGLLFGTFGDRFGRKAAMIGSLSLSVIGVALAAAAPSKDVMLAAAICAGFGIGGQWASGQTLVGETVPPDLRARFGAISQSGAPLGLALATLALIASQTLSWRTIFSIALVQVLLIVAIVVGVPESDLWKARRKRIAAGATDDRASVLELFRKDTLKPFLIAFLLTFLTMSNYWFTVSWLPEFMKEHWKLSITKSGFWTSAFVSGSLIGYLAFAQVSSRIGRRPAFTAFAALMALGTAMLTVFQSAIRDEPRLVLFFAFTAGVGTGLWSSFGPLYTEVFPTRVRTTAGGICMNVSRGAQFIGPQIIGQGQLAQGVMLAALFGLAAGACIWLLPETRGKKLAVDDEK